MQQAQKCVPIIPADGRNLALHDALLKWIPQPLQQRRHLGIDVLLKPIARVNAPVQPLEHAVEVLLRRARQRLLRQAVLHLQLEVVLRQVLGKLGRHLRAHARLLEPPRVRRDAGGQRRRREEGLVRADCAGPGAAAGDGGWAPAVHAAAALGAGVEMEG